MVISKNTTRKGEENASGGFCEYIVFFILYHLDQVLVITTRKMRVVHLADIHVQDRRRAEYAEVFRRLGTALRGLEPPPDSIVVAGDVYDAKTRASAHNIADVGDFLAGLSEIAPVIMIAGNHDTNLATPGAL